MVVHPTGFHTGLSPSGRPEYFRDVYGDATIGWVPAVSNYNFPENIPNRGPDNGSFRWEDVSIDLEDIQSGALIDFIKPDMYVLEVTPDLGWQNEVAMFGDDNDADAQNPHLKSLGPYTIDGGSITDNGDNTLTVDVDRDDFLNAATLGYGPHLWRAVPFADGNAGLGGFPARFEYISNETQLDFSIDNIVKETRKANQVITGKKSIRSTISIENDQNPTVFVEQSATSWRIWFSIDRPQVSFRILASDSGGGIVGYHKVSLEYESFTQIDGHVWNSFDGFGLLASINRLPEERNSELKSRITDAFSNKGGSHYTGLVRGINRELGITRSDSALMLTRAVSDNQIPFEPSIGITVTHTRLSVNAISFQIDNEVKVINPHENLITTDKRIDAITSIITDRGTIIDEKLWKVTEDTSGREIKLDPSVEGILKITYSYLEDFLFTQYTTLNELVGGINALFSPNGLAVLVASLDPRIAGSEPSVRLYHGKFDITSSTQTVSVGWSPVKLNSIANEEWKRSHEDAKYMYFGSSFYKYILELKSQTNVEWGSVVADEGVWDAVDDRSWGKAALPLVYDIRLSDWKLPATVSGKSSFDSWEAFRMGFYFGNALIKNSGFKKQSFQSGVGFTKDCKVSLNIENLSAEGQKINLNPFTTLPKDAIDIDPNLISDLILDI